MFRMARFPTHDIDASRREFLALVAATGVALTASDLVSAQPSKTTEPTMPADAALRDTNPLDEPVHDSHVGNLLGPIRRVRDAYGYASESFANEKFQAAAFPAWKQRMRQLVFDALHYAPAKAEFNVATVEKVDRGAFTREKIYFNTTPELRVPAYVLVPKNLGEKRAPAIVALHDHGGFYRWGKEKLVKADDEHPALTAFKGCYAGHSIADDLAEQGYVVIVIDMFYWGERRMRLSDDPKTGSGESDDDVKKFNAARGPLEPLVARTIQTAGFTWPGLIFWDDIRTIDYLASRPEVDPARIGCVGLSVGAWRANHLIALDDRIKAAVAVCWLTSFRDLQRNHVRNTTGFTKLLPGLYRNLDMPDVVSLAAPRPLLNINGAQDRLFPIDEGIKPAYRTLETVYDKLRAADKFRGHLYDSPHEFNEQMQVEAWAWLKKWV
jgi:dienelactone hydrolase